MFFERLTLTHDTQEIWNHCTTQETTRCPGNQESGARDLRAISLLLVNHNFSKLQFPSLWNGLNGWDLPVKSELCHFLLQAGCDTPSAPHQAGDPTVYFPTTMAGLTRPAAAGLFQSAAVCSLAPQTMGSGRTETYRGHQITQVSLLSKYLLNEQTNFLYFPERFSSSMILCVLLWIASASHKTGNACNSFCLPHSLASNFFILVKSLVFNLIPPMFFT